MSTATQRRTPSAPRPRSAAHAGLAVLAAVAVLAGVATALLGPATARAQIPGELLSGLQITPNRRQTLISKDIPLLNQRWSIAYNTAEQTITGIVYTPGAEPQFVYCEQTASGTVNITFACYGAPSCKDVLCFFNSWKLIGSVELPIGFITPRGNEAVCGNSSVEPGEICDPPGQSAGCPAGFLCGADCRACAAPPSCDIWQPLLGTLAIGSSSCTLQLTIDNRACLQALTDMSAGLVCSNGSADLSGFLVGKQVPAGKAGVLTFNATGCLASAYVRVTARGVTKNSNAVNCSLASNCGNGVIEPGEECDTGGGFDACPQFPDLLLCNPYDCRCEPGIL